MVPTKEMTPHVHFLEILEEKPSFFRSRDGEKQGRIFWDRRINRMDKIWVGVHGQVRLQVGNQVGIKLKFFDPQGLLGNIHNYRYPAFRQA